MRGTTWFSVEDAVRELAKLPYPPLAAPAVDHLRYGARRQDWTFTRAGEVWSW